MAPGGPGTPARALALIGFMGSGKTAVGRRLARLLDVPFVDTDELVVARSGPIVRIFEEQGEAAFRVLERDAVTSAVDEALRRPSVLSLGGGAVTDEGVRVTLRRLAHVVWLTAPDDVLWQRVSRKPGARPLAADREAFGRLLVTREQLYAEVATETIVNDGARPAAAVAAEIAAILAGTVAAGGDSGGGPG